MQAEYAKAALKRAAGDLAQDAAVLLNPRSVAEQYPWAGLGGAAAVGFALSAVLTPSGQDTVKEHYERIGRKLVALVERQGDKQGQARHAGQPSLKRRALHSLMGLGKAVLGGTISAALRPSAGEASGNGQHGRPADD